MLKSGEVLLGNFNYNEWANTDLIIDGEQKCRGLIPRNYETHPVGYCLAIPPYHAVNMPIIPQSEWSERIREKVAIRGQLSDIRMTGANGQPIPSLDQNSQGYCWAYSTGSMILLARAVQHQPYVRVSPHAVACKIKGFRDEGGWGAQSAEFGATQGYPSDAFWPQKSMSRQYDKPETWENAKLHVITEGWVDLQAQQYDRTLSREQFATCWLLNEPTNNDYNDWSHSVCGCDLVDGASTWGEIRASSGKLVTWQEFKRIWDLDDEGGGFGSRFWNSWGDGYGDKGMGIRTGSKAWPDGGTALRVTRPSIV